MIIFPMEGVMINMSNYLASNSLCQIDINLSYGYKRKWLVQHSNQ